MANFNNIKHEIDQNVNTNGVQAITGAILNETLKDMIDEVDSKKQDTLVAGSGIAINGNVISATGGSGQEYYAGNGIDIDQNNVISTDLNDIAGTGLNVSLRDNLPVLEVNTDTIQRKLIAGQNITISSNNEISATDTTYSAGQGLDLNGTTFSVDYDEVQEKLESGQNIKTVNGYSLLGSGDIVIQGGGGGNYLPLEGGTLQNTAPGEDTELKVIDGMDEDYVKIVAPESQGERPHVEIFENGSGDTKIYYDHIERGSQVSIDLPSSSGTLALTSDIPVAGSGLIENQNGEFEVDTTTIQEKLGEGDGIDIDASNNINVLYGTGLRIGSGGALEADLSTVQEKLVAGQNITITGNTISASGGSGQSYVAGSGIDITGNTISVDNTVATTSDLSGYLPLTGGNLQASSIATEVRVKSPSDDSYVYLHAVDTGSPTIKFHRDIQNPSNGEVHEITLHEERLDIERWDQSGNTWMADTLYFPQFKTGTIALDTDLAGKQDTLIAGQNITIQNNVISATGGGGSGLWSSGTGTNSLLSPSAVASSATASGTGALNAGYYNGQSGYASFANGDYSANFGTNNKVSYANSFASGLGNTTGGHEAFVGGGASNTASGDCSAVIGGTFGSAVGDNSVVIASGANGTANGNHSVAIGNATASGYGAIAIGEESSTNANHAIAIAGADATGVNSVAIGKKVGTNNENEIGLGFANKVYTSGTGSIKSAFTVGNGTFSNGNYTYSNGLELKGNSDFYVYGVGGFDGTNSYNGNNSGNRAKTLQEVLNDKQDTLTAGTGISISGNVISATGGSSLWTSGTGTDSLVGPDGGTSSGSGSISLNGGATATNSTSMAGGYRSSATGWNGFAYGNIAQASADASISLGDHTKANVASGIALGQHVETGNKQAGSVALGKYNYTDTGNTATQNTTFSIGNGTGTNARSNALELTAGDKFYMTGVGSYTGANASSATSVQDVINGKQDTLVSGTNIKTINGNSILGSGNLVISGGGGNYLPLTGGALQEDPNDNTQTNLEVYSPDSLAMGYIYSYSEDTSDPQNPIPSSVEVGLTGQPSGSTDATQGIYLRSNGTIAVDYLDSQGNSEMVELELPRKASGQTYTIATLDDIQGGSGNYLPLTGGSLQQDPASYSSTQLLVESPNQYSTVAIESVDLDPGNTAESMAKITLSDYDDQNNQHSVVYYSTGIGTGNYKISFPTPTQNDTFALLSDIQGGGGSGLWTSGAGTGSVMSPGATQANGNYSVSGGDGTRANGTGSVALGGNTTASGTYSTALGAGSSATNSYTVAIGHGVQAANQNETALGAFNLYTNSGTSAQKTFFTVGNGTGTNAKSNLIEAKENNDIYVVGVGNYDGTNAGATGVQTLQDAINNGGGGQTLSAGNGIDITSGTISVDTTYLDGLYVPITGGYVCDDISQPQTSFDVWSPDQQGYGYIHSYSEDSSDPNDVIPANAEMGLMGSVPSNADETYEVYHRSNGTILVGYTTDNQGNTDSVEFAFPQKPSGQTYTLATLDDIQGGGGSSLWTSGSGTDSLLGPSAIGADGAYSIAAGLDSDAQANGSVALSGGVVIYDDSDPNNILNAEYGVAIGLGSTVETAYSLAMMGGTASAQNGGSRSVAIGDAATAEGYYDVALTGSTSMGNYSFAASTGIAEGHYSTGLSGGDGVGEGSLASGFGSIAYGYSSAALGLELMTYDQADGTLNSDPNAGEAAFGRYNYSEQNVVFSIGCGHYEPPVDPTDPTDVGTKVRENAITITNDGKIYLKGLGGYTGTSVSGCTDLVSFLNNL